MYDFFRHTRHALNLGCVECSPENNFLRDLICAWTSIPTTTSHPGHLASSSELRREWNRQERERRILRGRRRRRRWLGQGRASMRRDGEFPFADFPFRFWYLTSCGFVLFRSSSRSHSSAQ